MSIKQDVDLVAHGAPALAKGLFYRVEHFGEGLLRLTVRRSWWIFSRLVRGTEVLALTSAHGGNALAAVANAAKTAHAALQAIEAAKAVRGDHRATAPEPEDFAPAHANPALIGTESAPTIVPPVPHR